MRGACSVMRDAAAGGWLSLLGLVLVVTGYFGPWVPHETAALTVTGFELAEFAKFFPQVQGGTVSLSRELFYLPLIAGLMLLILIVGRSANRLARWILAPLVAVLLLVALLPYPVVDAVRQALVTRSPAVLDPQYAGQLRLVLVGVVASLLSPLTQRLPSRGQDILVALLALAGVVPPLWQFAVLRPLISVLYDAPFGLGWGLVACTAGFSLLLISGVRAALADGSRSWTREP